MSRNTLIRRALDERGYNYLRERLSLGFTLAKAVVANLSNGIVYALVPDAVSDSAVYSFDYSIGISARDGYDAAISLILACSETDETATVIAESATVPPGAPEVVTWPFATFSRQDELYGVVSGETIDAHALERLLTLTDACYLSNVVVATGATHLQPLKDDIEESALVEISRNVALVFVRAYDGESYLVWQPDAAKFANIDHSR